MSDQEPIIGAVYERKLERRAFAAAYHAAVNAYDAWSQAMMNDKADKARYQRVILLKAMDEAMRASGMDPNPGNYRQGEE